VELGVSEAKVKILYDLDGDTSNKSHMSFEGRGNRSDRSSSTYINALCAIVCHLKKPISELHKVEGDPLRITASYVSFAVKLRPIVKSPMNASII